MVKIGILMGYLLLLDGLWITFFMGPWYQDYLGMMLHMSEGMRLYISLVLVYGLMLLGLFRFVLVPDMDILGAVTYGVVLYGVFALTNFVIFHHWPIYLVLADTLWGGVLFGSTYIVAKYIQYI